MPATDHMQVEVKDRLPGIRSGIDHQAETAILQSGFGGKAFGSEQHVPQQVLVRG